MEQTNKSMENPECCGSCEEEVKPCNFRKVEENKLPACCLNCDSVRKGAYGFLFCGQEPENTWAGLVRATNICDYWEATQKEAIEQSQHGVNVDIGDRLYETIRKFGDVEKMSPANG